MQNLKKSTIFLKRRILTEFACEKQFEQILTVNYGSMYKISINADKIGLKLIELNGA